MTCQRCLDAQEKGVLHSYLWTPPENFDSPPLFFNVAEIRLYMIKERAGRLEQEEWPYTDNLVGLTTSHEITYDHIFHVPVNRIKPSLVGNLFLRNKATNVYEPVSLMLDGHHSAMSCMIRKVPVRVEFVDSQLLERLAYRSMEELIDRPIMVLEGIDKSLLV